MPKVVDPLLIFTKQIATTEVIYEITNALLRMKHVKLFWTVGCWISLVLLSVYHSVFHRHESAFPVWYATFTVWMTGLATLASLRKTR
jgi:hypothetical protein